METELARAVQIADKDAQYDECAKRILSNKYVLAHILIHVVDEFKSMSLEEVLPCFVEGPYISQVPVNPGETNKSTVSNGERVVTFDSENGEINEGILRFDVIFKVRLRRGISEFIINVEAQKDDPSKYPILNRAIFFACRMISSQKERDFANDYYGDMKPVYSIWINMNKKYNGLAHYHLDEHRLFGKNKWKGNSKLLNIVMIGLAKKSPEKKQSELHHLLGTLFSKEISVEEKLKIIEAEYQIPIEKEIGKELEDMCNLSQIIREEATLEGIEIGKKLGKEEGRIVGKTEGIGLLVLNMYKNSISPEQISQMTDLALERIERIIEESLSTSEK